MLVVDDDPAALPVLARGVAEAHTGVLFAATSAAQARSVWAEYKDKINVLVTDIMMPTMTGDELALEFWAEKPSLKVLFVSGNDPDNLQSLVPLKPGVNFLRKPFNRDELVTTLQRLMDEKPEVF